MIRDVRLEFAKLRRLHSIPLLVLMVAVVVGLSVFSLFDGDRSRLTDPAARPWELLLLSYTMMAAISSPILVAVLASRQTELETDSGGWVLAATVGRAPGQLCRAKLIALALLLLPAVAAQTLALVVIGRLVGITVDLSVGPWVGYSVGLYLVDVACCALHIWLAARVPNQLLSLALGTLGSFIAVVSLIVPSVLVRVLPWNYYAMISRVGQVGEQVTYIAMPVGWVIAFLLVVAVGFLTATHRLNRRDW